MVCVVCQEGYRSKPGHVLAVYVYCKGVRLPLGAKLVSTSGPPRATSTGCVLSCVLSCERLALTVPLARPWAMSSASSFVCIHPSCHDSAARADRSHPKAPKDEWEGAALRNGHVRCNNLLPLRGPAHIPMYDAALHAYFERIDRGASLSASRAAD